MDTNAIKRITTIKENGTVIRTRGVSKPNEKEKAICVICGQEKSWKKMVLSWSFPIRFPNGFMWRFEWRSNAYVCKNCTEKIQIAIGKIIE